MKKIIVAAVALLTLAGCAQTRPCPTLPGGKLASNCSTTVPVPTVPPKAS